MTIPFSVCAQRRGIQRALFPNNADAPKEVVFSVIHVHEIPQNPATAIFFALKSIGVTGTLVNSEPGM